MAEGFLACAGMGLGGEGVGWTHLVRLPGGLRPCLRSSGPRALSATDLDLSLLQLAGVGSDLVGRVASHGVAWVLVRCEVGVGGSRRALRLG